MKNTVGQIKRLLGRKWDADLQAELPMLGNPPVVPLPDDKIGLEVCRIILILFHVNEGKFSP
jgi:hypothetical protein